MDYTADVVRAILRQVYVWADGKSAIYLDGSGCRDAEDFLDPPRGSVKYFVFAGDKPAALLTLIPLVTVRGVYQVGLITNPQASLRILMCYEMEKAKRNSAAVCNRRA